MFYKVFMGGLMMRAVGKGFVCPRCGIPMKKMRDPDHNDDHIGNLNRPSIFWVCTRCKMHVDIMEQWSDHWVINPVEAK
jgi:DNA-directed RNA polymerase subunit RPC12/RpoP